MKIDLKGQTALVTGAGSGIGAGCARSLAEAGAFVWVNDLDPARATAIAGEIGGAALPGDVSRPGDWLLPVLERGVLHTLVHNAGYDLETPVGATDVATFEQLLRVQLTGPFEITQRLLPALRAAQGAAVIHIASVHATATTRGMSAYAAAKGGQVAMVRAMAIDLGPDQIRALAVSPGYIDTPLMDQWIAASPNPEEALAWANAQHPMGRIGLPNEVGDFVAFLASPLAGFLNGVELKIDGALTAWLRE